jgi:hypothetical protein
MYYYLFVRDIAEIFCYSFIIYTFCIWLKTDKTKNLLSYFLAYCAITIFSWMVELPTLTPFLFSYAPIALILFIIMHEKTLQRNLVALRTITPVQPYQEDWLDILLSSALAIINNNKSITIVIENKDSLEYFLTTPFFINADISKHILSILFSSNSYDEQKIIWVNTHGQIRGINAIWQTERTEQQITTAHMLWNKKDALFYTLQCDATIIHINQFVRTFTLVSHGNEIQDIPVHEIKNRIKKQLSQHPAVQTKGFSRENNSHKTSLTK